MDRVNTSGAHYPRKSYVEATGVPNKRIRGRPRSTGKKDEVNGLKRRPSLNKQMRKKFETVFGSKPKQQNNLDLLTRIRSIPESIFGEVFNIKVNLNFEMSILYSSLISTKRHKICFRLEKPSSI